MKTLFFNRKISINNNVQILSRTRTLTPTFLKMFQNLHVTSTSDSCSNIRFTSCILRTIWPHWLTCSVSKKNSNDQSKRLNKQNPKTKLPRRQVMKKPQNEFAATTSIKQHPNPNLPLRRISDKNPKTNLPPWRVQKQICN